MIKVNGEALSKVINFGIMSLKQCRIIDSDTVAIAELLNFGVQRRKE